jgi:LPS-assembly lipoprotein
MNIRILISLVLCLAVSGCGWQLRGSKNITANIEALTVMAEMKHGKLVRSLDDAMHVQHIADSGQNAWQLIVLSEDLKQNVVAFSDTNNAASTEIELVVHFTVLNDKGETVIAPNTERVVRIYESDNNRRLAMDRETNLLKDEVYQEMANNLLRRIDFIAGQKK